MVRDGDYHQSVGLAGRDEQAVGFVLPAWLAVILRPARRFVVHPNNSALPLESHSHATLL